MTRYRLPEQLGGGEMEPDAHLLVPYGDKRSHAGFMVKGEIVFLPLALLTEVKPPLPEPPAGSVVMVGADPMDLTEGLVYRRYHQFWSPPGSEGDELKEWADLHKVGTPVHLVPDPFAEPVTLPWEFGYKVVVGTGDEDPVGLRVGVEYLSLGPDDARGIARALWTAANEAEATP